MYSKTGLHGHFTISQQSCVFMIICSISEHLVSSRLCRIRYRRINGTITSEIHLTINQHHLFGVLYHNTTYLIEATFKLMNVTLSINKTTHTQKGEFNTYHYIYCE